MNEKKNIDRLYQERFKDFETTPGDDVWQNIVAKQQQQNNKKVLVLPIWYRIAGVAAVIAILITAGTFVFDNSNQNNTITDTNDKNQIKESKNVLPENSNTPESTIVNQSKTNPENNISTDKIITNNSKTTDAIVNTDAKTNNGTTTADSRITKRSSNSDNLINATVSGTQQSNYSNEGITTQTANAIAENYTKSNPESENNSIIQESNTGDEKLTIAENKINTEKSKNDLLLSNSEKENNDLQQKAEAIADASNKKSIFDAIKESKQREEEVADAPESKQHRWNLNPNIAPVYYNSITNGSPIDNQFTDNDKNGQVNMSYGVQVAYEVNNRLSVRSGINKVDLSYSTQGIEVGSSINARGLQSVDYNDNGFILNVNDTNASPPSAVPTDLDLESRPNNAQPGSIQQKFGYIEVPVELKYAVVDKKIGVNMIGGLSTLILENNEILVTSKDVNTSFGQANNLNDVSFSGNIGVGVDYNISEKFQINLEPIFKYQFNAFSENAGDFQPYYFGVYTGVSFKF